MKIFLGSDFELDFFQIEQITEAQLFAGDTNKDLYSWKSIGYSNWLEKGVSVVDVLGVVLLSKGSPNRIDLPNDTRK